MEKIVDRLLIEFLIPSLLMLACIALLVDLVMGKSFDLIRSFPKDAILTNSVFLIGGISLSYIINTSLSSMLNLVSRKWWWGYTREYLMYRKLDIFKEEGLKEKNIWWLSYLKNRSKIMNDIEKAKDNREGVNLYCEMIDRLEKKGVPDQWLKDILDIYDVIRTLVMSSQDSTIIGWIQYHWGQLRLARSTLAPTMLLVILFPFALYSWNRPLHEILIALIFATFLFFLQLAHYYYRERFMVYAMVGYFITKYESNVTGENITKQQD